MAVIKSVVLGGVPEHFNVPLMLGIKRGIFAKLGLNVSFRECPGGTGEQLKLLDGGDVSACVALTEGLVCGLLEKGDSAGYRLLGTYVKSPLCWSAAVHPDSSFEDLSQLRSAVFGVSRYFSGSHLVPYLHALRNGWLSPRPQPNQIGSSGANGAPDSVDEAKGGEPLQFRVCSNFAGLREAVRDRKVDVFLWELATTQACYDSGELRHIGNIEPSWPAFSLALRADVDSAAATALLRGVRECLAHWATLSNQARAAAVIDALPAYQAKDVTWWLRNVQFAQPADVGKVSAGSVAEIVDMLVSAGVLRRNSKDLDPARLLCQAPDTASLAP